MKTALKVILSTGVLAGVALVVAQMPMSPMNAQRNISKPRVGSDTLSFKSTLGSFKLLGTGETPAKGNLSVSFRGTMLLTDPQGDYRFEGDVRKEYEDKAHKKVAYFGKGRLVMNGSVKSAQFFGSDIDGTYTGFGFLRLYGEFDKNYDTGSFQYKGTEARPWGTGGIGLPIPQMIYDQAAGEKPRVEDAP